MVKIQSVEEMGEKHPRFINKIVSKFLKLDKKLKVSVVSILLILIVIPIIFDGKFTSQLMQYAVSNSKNIVYVNNGLACDISKGIQCKAGSYCTNKICKRWGENGVVCGLQNHQNPNLDCRKGLACILGDDSTGYCSLSSGAANALPIPDTTNNLHLALISDNSLYPTNVTKEEGKIDIVWSSGYCGSNPKNVQISGVFHSCYSTLFSNFADKYKKEWFFAHHPDWILYQNPNTTGFGASLRQTLPYDFSGVEAIPLDFNNSNVISWLFENYFKKPIDSNYQGISFDNVTSIQSKPNEGVFNYNEHIKLNRTSTNSTTTIFLSKRIPINSYIAIGGTSNMLNCSKNATDINCGNLNIEYAKVISINQNNSISVTLNKPITNVHYVGEPIGIWQDRYSSNLFDPHYQTDFKHQFSKVVDLIKSYAKSKNRNFLVLINNMTAPPFWRNPNIWLDLISSQNDQENLQKADIVVDEGGFTNYGFLTGPLSNTSYLSSDQKLDLTSNPWLVKMQLFQKLNDLGKGLIIVDTFRDPVSTPDIDPKSVLSKEQIQWALANYLLIKGKHTFQAVLTGRVVLTDNPQYNYLFDLPQYHLQIGYPVINSYSKNDLMYKAGNTSCYARDYSQGVVYVNPSSFTSCNIKLTHSYHDIFGKIFSDKINIRSLTGLILLR